MIWRRHAEHAGSPATAWYMRRQAERMFRFEGDICRRAGQIAAVSEQDACAMRTLFGAERVTAIPTGVDIEFFTPPSPAPAVEVDLSFTGSMDWQPNVDGVLWFTSEVLPLIRRERPDCSLAIVGRKPSGAILDLARRDPRIRVTGTVPDIRPHLWNSAVSIVPLRIGGGTRLKIYESMAARVPVVSTAIGAEGLEIHPPSDIRIADTPTSFADACLGLLADAALRQRQADAAWRMVSASFSWEQAARCFESVLERAPALVRAAGAGGR
jgi:polysaccharide biosynthesis protein PslH